MSPKLKIGDTVCLPWMPNGRFLVLCVEDNELWARDLSDGAHLTLAVDTCERIR